VSVLSVGDRVVMRDVNERRLGGPRFGVRGEGRAQARHRPTRREWYHVHTCPNAPRSTTAETAETARVVVAFPGEVERLRMENERLRRLLSVADALCQAWEDELAYSDGETVERPDIDAARAAWLAEQFDKAGL
jgi:hypothetical protein